MGRTSQLFSIIERLPTTNLRGGTSANLVIAFSLFSTFSCLFFLRCLSGLSALNTFFQIKCNHYFKQTVPCSIALNHHHHVTLVAKCSPWNSPLPPHLLRRSWAEVIWWSWFRCGSVVFTGQWRYGLERQWVTGQKPMNLYIEGCTHMQRWAPQPSTIGCFVWGVV